MPFHNVFLVGAEMIGTCQVCKFARKRSKNGRWVIRCVLSGNVVSPDMTRCRFWSARQGKIALDQMRFTK